jgi:hypothetical protein
MNYLVKAVQTTDDEFAFPEFKTLEENIAITNERILKGANRVWLRKNRLEVYREHDKTGIIRYFAVDKEADPKITLYCVRLDYSDVKPLRAGCQIGVWADPSNLVVAGLAKDIFWQILFKHHDMISDSIQTQFGRKFWVNRLAEAFDAKLSVYSLKFTNGKIKDAKLYPNVDALHEDFNKLWGPKITDRSRRLMICLHPLDFAGHQKTYATTEKAMAELKVPQAWIDAGNRMNKKPTTKEEKEEENLEEANQSPMAVPQAWVASVKKNKVTARIDMSAEVAGAGLCPDCRKPMDRCFANGIECYVCHSDRIAIPVPDPVEGSNTIDPGTKHDAIFGPSTAESPV